MHLRRMRTIISSTKGAAMILTATKGKGTKESPIVRLFWNGLYMSRHEDDRKTFKRKTSKINDALSTASEMYEDAKICEYGRW